jgi:hypothetical protein
MATPSSVVGCSACGALYTPAPGDGRLCDGCRITVADDPSARPLPPTPQAEEETSDEAVDTGRPAPPPRSGKRRGLRRIVVGAIAAVQLIGATAALISKREALAEMWTSMRQHSVQEAWSAVRHRSADAWVFLRRHIPAELLQPHRDGDERGSAKEATTSNGAHRHAQHPGKGKRSKGQHEVASK